MTLDDLASPTWWMTAVIGAVAIKVVADYVRTGITKLTLGGYAAWSSRTALAKADHDRQVAKLRTSSELREIYFQRECRLRHRASFFLIGMVFTAVIMLSVRILYKLASLPSAPYPYAYFHMDLKYAIPVIAIAGGWMFAQSASAMTRAGYIALMLEDAIAPADTTAQPKSTQQ